MKGSLHFGCWGTVTVMPETFAAAWRPLTRQGVPWERARMAWNCSLSLSAKDNPPVAERDGSDLRLTSNLQP